MPISRENWPSGRAVLPFCKQEVAGSISAGSIFLSANKRLLCRLWLDFGTDIRGRDRFVLVHA